MADEDYGNARIRIVLDDRAVASEGQAAGRRLEQAIGRATRNIGRNIIRYISQAVQAARPPRIRIDADVRGLKQQIQRAATQMRPPRIRIDADVRGLRPQIQRAATQMRAVRIPVAADSRQFQLSLSSGRSARVRVTVVPDLVGFMRALQVAATKIGPVTVQVRVDRASFRTAMLSLPKPPPITIPVRYDTSGARFQTQQPPPLNIPINGSGISADLSGALKAGAAAGVAAAAALITTGIKGAIASINISADFEYEMNKVRALTGATGDSFDQLNAKAKELGSSTRYSAAEAAGGMQELGKVGFDTEQIIAALPDVLNLATAAGIGMADSAALMTNAMAAFQIPAKDAAMVADQWAAITSKANADVPGLAAGLANVGATASIAGLSLGDTSRALAAMTDAGIPAADAGTALRNVIDGLAKGGAHLDRALKANNISLKDASGAARPLIDVIRDLATSGLSAADSQKVFGIEGKKALDVIGLNIGKFDELGKAVEDSAGSTQKMADIMGSGAKGAMVSFKSAVEGLAIAIGSTGLLTVFTNVAESVTSFIQALGAGDTGKMSEIVSGWVETLGGLGGQIVSKIEELAPQVIAAMFRLGEKIGQTIDQWGPQLVKIGAMLQAALPAITGILTGLVLSLLAGLLSGLGQQLLSLMQGLWDVVANFFTTTLPAWGMSLGPMVLEALTSLLNAVSEFFAELPGRIMAVLASIPGLLVDLFVNAVAAVGIALLTAVAGIVVIFTQLPGKISAALAALGTAIGGQFTAAFARGRALVGSFATSTVSFFSGLPSRIGSALSSLPGRISGAFRSAGASARSAVSGFLSGIVSMFAGLGGRIVGAMGDIAGRIRSKIVSGLPGIVRSNLPGFADGGIITRHQIVQVGEGGRPEVIIPLTRPQRARQLAEQSGLTDILGAAPGPRGQAAGATTINNWTLNEVGDAETTAARVLSRLTMAAGVI